MLGAVLVLAALTACNRAAHRDKIEERHPLLRKAKIAEKANNIDKAIELYQTALEHNADMARAHLGVGLLYDKPKEDYIRAIYHYERYLELRPDAEKRKVVEDLIRWAKLSYAASLPDQPSGAVKLIAALKQQISDLRMRVEEMEIEEPEAVSVMPEPGAPASASPPKVKLSPPPPAPAEAPMNVYRVQAGDTLSRIAVKMYNDANKWRDIYEANRDKLDRPNSLRPGQMLVIP